VLAAHGSGATALSLDQGLTLLHFDVGGGTTKVNLIERGRVSGTAAYNVGARLVAFDERGVVERLERAGARFAVDLGLGLAVGLPIDKDARARMAARMAAVLLHTVLTGQPPWPELVITGSLRAPIAIDGLAFSGGVSEYIYGRETETYGDLGPDLGGALRELARGHGYTVFDPEEGIRATVIGASQYSVQLSGETVFIPDLTVLPFRNLRTVVVYSEWDAVSAQSSVREGLGTRDPEEMGFPYALLVATPPFRGYAAAQQLAEGLRSGLLALPAGDRPAMLVFEQNVGQVVGRALSPDLTIPSIDEVNLSQLDFIDVGTPVPGESYVPVVVKSLAFGA
jgi:ethanolamine utilization protein EutA